MFQIKTDAQSTDGKDVCWSFEATLFSPRCPLLLTAQEASKHHTEAI
jgi:hypothetical protein